MGNQLCCQRLNDWAVRSYDCKAGQDLGDSSEALGLGCTLFERLLCVAWRLGRGASWQVGEALRHHHVRH